MDTSRKLTARMPWALWIFGCVGIFFLVLPMVALLSKVSWSNFWLNITKPAVLSALKVSVGTSVAIACVAVLLGVPLAYLLSRGPVWFTSILRPIVISALVFPPTVAGLALLALFGEETFLGKFIFNLTGWALPGSTGAVILAGLFVGMPFLVLVVQASFDQIDLQLEEYAETEGASSSKIFWLVVFPQTASAIFAGACLTWARALGEFGATMTFAGAIPGKTFTTAMQIYADLKIDEEAAYCLSALMLIISLSVLVLTLQRWLPVVKGK